jgi:hypothetical protein
MRAVGFGLARKFLGIPRPHAFPGGSVWGRSRALSAREIRGAKASRFPVTDALTPDEATSLLDANAPTRAERERQMREFGFPAYTIIAGAGLYVRRVRLPRTLAFASLNPFFPDSIQASLLKIIRRHDDSEFDVCVES